MTTFKEIINAKIMIDGKYVYLVSTTHILTKDEVLTKYFLDQRSKL